MFGQTVSNGLSLGKVASGISKTLGVVNQVIPLYKEAKPMIDNARTIISALSSRNTKGNANNSTTIKKDTINKESIRKFNNPSFFL